MNDKVLFIATFFTMFLCLLGYGYSTRQINIKIVNMSLSHRSIYIDPIYGDPTWDTEVGENSLSTVGNPLLHGSPGEQEVPYETAFAFDFQAEEILDGGLSVDVTQSFNIAFYSVYEHPYISYLTISNLTDGSSGGRYFWNFDNDMFNSYATVVLNSMKFYQSEHKELFIYSGLSEDTLQNIKSHTKINTFPERGSNNLSLGSLDNNIKKYYDPYSYISSSYHDGQYYITLIFKGW